MREGIAHTYDFIHDCSQHLVSVVDLTNKRKITNGRRMGGDAPGQGKEAKEGRKRPNAT